MADIRRRCALLLAGEIPLVKFAAAYTHVLRQVRKFQLIRTLHPDVIARAVLVHMATCTYTPIPPYAKRILTVYPNADATYCQKYEHVPFDTAVMEMAADGYYKCDCKHQMLRVLMEQFATPASPSVAYTVAYNTIKDAFPFTSLVSVKNVSSAFYGDVHVCSEVLKCMPNTDLKRPRKRVASTPTLIYRQEKKENSFVCMGTCAVCMDDLHCTKCNGECSDGQICKACLFQYVHTELYENNKPVRTCVGKCGGVYNDASLETVLGSHFIFFLQLESRAVVEKMGSTMATCPNCDIPCIADDVAKLEGGVELAPPSSFTCSYCNFVYCTLCKKPYHAPSSCETVGLLEKEARLVEEKLSDALIRECACGKRFVKRSGCNKMTCVCGRHVCYICQQIIDGYTHFCSCGNKESCTKCHIYTDDTKLIQKAQDEIIDEAKRMGTYHL